MAIIMRTTKSSPIVVPADWIPGPKQGEWTYEDYAALPEDGHRYEVIGGVLYMSPSPGPEHQEIVVELIGYIRSFVMTHKLGRVYTAPLDVELGHRNVVQPDVFVVLKGNRGHKTKTRFIGAPDLAVEVASPSTAKHDRQKKRVAYARANVPEYWIVNPKNQTIEVLVLEGNLYRSFGFFSGHDTLPSRVLPDLPVSIEQFFL